MPIKLKVWIEKHEGLILLVLMSLVLRIPSLFEPYWYGDEGIYLVLGQGLRKGLVWYRDIHDNKPPLLYLLAAVSGNVFYFRLLLAVWFGATVIVFFKLIQTLLPKQKPAWYWATLLMIVLTTLTEGNIANAEIFMALPAILGMWLTYLNRHLWLAGVSFALAFLLKVPAGFDWVAAVLWLTVFKPVRFKLKEALQTGWWKLTGGFLGLIGLTIVYYGLVGGLEPYVRSALLQNIGYLASWQTGAHEASAVTTQTGLFQRGIILAISLAGFYWISLKFKLGQGFRLVVIWFLMALFGALLSERPYPHYLIQPAIPAAILIGFFFWGKRKMIRLTTVGLAALATAAYLQVNFWHYPLLPYYQNFARYVLGQKSQVDYRNYFDPRVQQTHLLAEYLVQTTLLSERIFIWGDEPGVYALANRLPIGRYTVAYHVLDFNGYEETMAAWEKNPPVVVLVMNYEKRVFPDMEAKLATDYVFVTQIGQAKIYRSL